MNINGRDSMSLRVDLEIDARRIAQHVVFQDSVNRALFDYDMRSKVTELIQNSVGKHIESFAAEYVAKITAGAERLISDKN